MAGLTLHIRVLAQVATGHYEGRTVGVNWRVVRSRRLEFRVEYVSIWLDFNVVRMMRSLRTPLNRLALRARWECSLSNWQQPPRENWNDEEQNRSTSSMSRYNCLNHLMTSQ